MEQRAAEAVNVAAEIFRLMVEHFRCNIIGGAPDIPVGFLSRLLQGNCQAEIHDLGCVRSGEKDVPGFNVAVNQARMVSGPQSHRGLNANF